VATLQDAKELTAPLEQLTKDLNAELTNPGADFDRLVQLADELGAQADAFAETFGSINATLMERIKAVRENGSLRSSPSRLEASATQASATEASATE
jgi:hypothetical protein